jgi:nucleotide-binding universal stress UspA family protein
VSYKTILLHLDDAAGADKRIDAAIGLAQAHDAHLVGLCTPTPIYLPWSPEAGNREEFLALRRAEDEIWGKKVLANFEAAAAKAGLSKRESRYAVGDPREVLDLHARYADLIVVGQADPNADGARDAASRVEETILSCGRPVLLIPYIGLLAPVGRRVIIAWDASREATRAVSDALPMLARADKVMVVTVDAEPSPYGHGQLPGADLALFLSRHGLDVEALHVGSSGVRVGETLLNQASDRNADLMVMGCYGHSRMRELILGGATRTMLQSMPIPVLMSH